MFPHDLTLGPVVFNGYGLMVAIGVALGFLLIKFSAPPAGTTFTDAFNLGVGLVIAGLIGARAAYVLVHLGPFLKRPAEMLMYWQGGLMFQGGLMGGLALALYLAAKGRIRFLTMGDAFAPALALGQGVGRLGCLLAGCCYGRPSPRWLGITFPQASQAPWGVPLYPTQPMESAGLLILAFFLLLSLKRMPSAASMLSAFPQGFSPENSSQTLPLPGSLDSRSLDSRSLVSDSLASGSQLPVSPNSAHQSYGPAGRVFALYLVWSGLIRLFLEYFRGDDRGSALFTGLRPTSLAALLIVTIGLGLRRYLKLPPRGATSRRIPRRYR